MSELSGRTMVGCPNRLRCQIPSSISSYQLRVVLRGVSPLIWRRLLIRSDTTIADLHATLRTALGWSDEHLNRFVIHGRDYGVSHDGGIGFRDDQRQVRLVDLGLRVGERFVRTSTTSPMAGCMTCALSRSSRSRRTTASQPEAAGDARCRPRTVVGRGHSMNCASGTPLSTAPSA